MWASFSKFRTLSVSGTTCFLIIWLVGVSLLPEAHEAHSGLSAKKRLHRYSMNAMKPALDHPIVDDSPQPPASKSAAAPESNERGNRRSSFTHFIRRTPLVSQCLSNIDGLNVALSENSVSPIVEPLVISVCINVAFVDGKVEPTMRLFENQVRDFVDAGYPARATVYAVFSIPQEGNESIEDYLLKVPELFRLKGFEGQVHVIVNTGNLFEYPALHVAWMISCANPTPNHVVLYFHTKGSSHLPKDGSLVRTHSEMALFYEIVVPWEDILTIFNLSDSDLVCLSYTGSFPWFNFWWARASFIATREEVEPSARRHYFEDWLHRSSQFKSECPTKIPDDLVTYMNTSKEHTKLSGSRNRTKAFTLRRCRISDLNETDAPVDALMLLQSRVDILFPLSGYTNSTTF